MFTNMVPASWIACVRSPDSSSDHTLISSGVFLLAHLQVFPPRHCVSREVPERPSSKSCSRPGILCEPSPGAVATGICNRSPDAFEESSGIRGYFDTATLGTWFSDLHLTSCPSLVKDGDSLLFHSLELPIRKQQHRCDRNIQIVDISCRFFRRLCLSAGGRGFF